MNTEIKSFKILKQRVKKLHKTKTKIHKDNTVDGKQGLSCYCVISLTNEVPSSPYGGLGLLQGPTVDAVKGLHAVKTSGHESCFTFYVS